MNDEEFSVVTKSSVTKTRMAVAVEINRVILNVYKWELQQRYPQRVDEMNIQSS